MEYCSGGELFDYIADEKRYFVLYHHKFIGSQKNKHVDSFIILLMESNIFMNLKLYIEI